MVHIQRMYAFKCVLHQVWLKADIIKGRVLAGGMEIPLAMNASTEKKTNTCNICSKGIQRCN